MNQTPTKARATTPSSGKVINWIYNRSRITRIILAMIPAFAITALMQPLLDILYFRYADETVSRALPGWIATGFSVILYFVGWYFIVGARGENLHEKRGTGWYLFLSTIIIVLVIAVYTIQYLIASQ